MILNDKEIAQHAIRGMINPFEPAQVREMTDKYLEHPLGITYPVISFGLTSFGYDIRLSGREFKVFHRIPGQILDPKKFNAGNLERSPLYSDDAGGRYFVLPANSYGLGVAIEELHMPDDVVAICVGKSTYARCGIIVNVTPAEPGWKGHLTLEFSNSSAADCRIYAHEGVAQILFFKGNRPAVTYGDRNGKYQDQGHEIVLPKV